MAFPAVTTLKRIEDHRLRTLLQQVAQKTWHLKGTRYLLAAPDLLTPAMPNPDLSGQYAVNKWVFPQGAPTTRGRLLLTAQGEDCQ